MALRIPIRIKIILSLLIPLIIALLILTITGSDLINTGAQEIARDQEASLAYMISERLSDNLNRYPGLLKDAIPDARADHADIDRIRQELNTMRDSDLDLIFDQGTGVYSRDGTLLAYAGYHPDGKWEDLPREQVREIMSGRRAVYTPLRTTASPPYFSLYVPIFNESGPVSVIEGRISPEYSLFGSMLVNILEIEKGTAGYAILMDKEGHILYQRFQGDLYEETGTNLAEIFTHGSLSQNSSAVLITNLTGREHYAGYHPVSETGWVVIAHEDRQVILRNLDQYLNLTWLMIIGAVVITILLIILLINRILSPIPVLISRVKQVREGSLEPFPFPPYMDEIGTLATEFNQMVASLRASFLKLETSKKRYQSIINQAYDGVIIMDAETFSIQESNNMASTITGYPPDQLPGMPFSALLLPPEATGFGDIIRDISGEGMKKEYEGEIVRNDGTRRYAEINLTRINIEGHDYIQATIRDISSRKKAEQELMERTEELDRFFSVNLDLLSITDMDGMFRRVNPEWETTLGYRMEELLVTRISDLVHQDDKETVLMAMKELSEGRAVINLEIRMLCRDGSYRWIEWRSFPHEFLIYSSARDITSRKEADERIRTGIQMLARNQETLAILNDQIRNPLSIISILNEGNSPDKEQRIQNEIQRIDEIINKLDNGWLMSDKVRRIMKKHYDIDEKDL